MILFVGNPLTLIVQVIFIQVNFRTLLQVLACAPHRLILKVCVPIMLIRNIDQSIGLCNETRMVVTKLGKSVIEAITLNGSHPNEKVFIHRMDMNPSELRLSFN